MIDLVEQVRELRGKITPGPWRTSDFAEGSEFEVLDANGGYIAGVAFEPGNGRMHAAARVDARLIALAPDMADEIDRLTKENFALTKRDTGWSLQCEEQQSEIDRLTKLVKEAREALEPFARCSTGSEDEVPGDTSVRAETLYYHMSAKHIARLANAGMTIPDNRVSLIVSFDGLRIGDFRRARTLLTKLTDGGGE